MKQNSISKHANEPLLRLCYLTLLLLSGETTIELTSQNISERFFIDAKTARRIIALLENLVAEDTNAHLALEGASYDTIRRNPHSNAFELPSLRLTERETTAFLSSLISTGLENNDATLSKLDNLIPVDANVDEILKQNYTADHTSHHSISPWKIAICCLSKQRFTFDYRRNDGKMKSYVVDPLYVMYKEERWYMNAWDIEEDKQKLYILSKMKNLKPTNLPAEIHDYVKRNTFTFDGIEKTTVSFKNRNHFDVIGHSSFEIVDVNEDEITAFHDSSQPLWIAKQVAASGGTITTNSETVQNEASLYARKLIEKAKSL